MAFKVIFVLAASLAVLVSAGAIPKKDENLAGAFDGLLDFAEELIVGINALIHETIFQTAHAIRYFADGFKELKDYGTQLIQGIAEREIQALNKLVDNVKDKSDEKELDILLCVEEVAEEAGNIQAKAVNHTLLCINTAIQQVEKDSLQVLLDLRALNENLKKEEEKISTCKNETIPIGCVKNIINKITDLALTLPTKIQPSAEQVQKDFADLGSTIKACVEDGSSILKNETDRVFEVFSQCVWDREHSSSTPA